MARPNILARVALLRVILPTRTRSSGFAARVTSELLGERVAARVCLTEKNTRAVLSTFRSQILL